MNPAMKLKMQADIAGLFYGLYCHNDLNEVICDIIVADMKIHTYIYTLCAAAIISLSAQVTHAQAAGNLTPTQAKTAGEVQIEVDGDVQAQHNSENFMFIGGDFSQIKVQDASAISRENLAIINLDTTALSSWNPSFNGPVSDIASYENLLIVSGQFTQIDTIDQPYLAIFDMNTQTLVENQYRPDGPVFSIEMYEGTLFMGGAFDRIDASVRPGLAGISLTADQILEWNPAPNAPVYSLLIDEEKLYVGGGFTRIAEEERQYLASFFLPSGVLSPWAPGTAHPVHRLEKRGDRIIALTRPEGDVETVVEESTDTDVAVPPAAAEITASPVVVIPEDEEATVAGLMIDTDALGFSIPSLGDILTFAVRIFFVIAGLAALFYLLLGALAWVTSGGDKDAVTAAREKIQAAVIGLIMMVAVLAIVWTLEQVIFKRRICLGLSCPLTLPSLIKPIEESSP